MAGKEQEAPDFLPAVLLLGRTGAGKSSIASCLAGSDLKGNDLPFPVGHFAAPCTDKPSVKKVQVGTRDLVVADTVGLGDAKLDDTAVASLVAEALDAIHAHGAKLVRVLYCVRGKATAEELASFKFVRDVLLPDVGPHLTLVRTAFPFFTELDKCDEDRKAMTGEAATAPLIHRTDHQLWVDCNMQAADDLKQSRLILSTHICGMHCEQGDIFPDTGANVRKRLQSAAATADATAKKTAAALEKARIEAADAKKKEIAAKAAARKAEEAAYASLISDQISLRGAGGISDRNALQYIASYPDLIAALGMNASKGIAHFHNHGRHEGRVVSFCGLRYIAAYPDLIRAFGEQIKAGKLTGERGAQHYIEFGHKANENRNPERFEPLRYIASYPDLIKAFGPSQEKGSRHMIEFGLEEGRQITFVGDEVAAMAHIIASQ